MGQVAAAASISAKPGQQMRYPMEENEPLDDLPDVETFAVDVSTEEPAQDETYNHHPTNTVNGITFDENLAPPIIEEKDEDDHCNNRKFENEELNDENSDEENNLCEEVLKSGARAGEPCGLKAKIAGKCTRHYKSSLTSTSPVVV